MNLMATDTSAQYAPIEGGWDAKGYHLLTFSYKQHSRVDVFSYNVFWLLFPTTVLGGSSVGAHK